MAGDAKSVSLVLTARVFALSMVAVDGNVDAATSVEILVGVQVLIDFRSCSCFGRRALHLAFYK